MITRVKNSSILHINSKCFKVSQINKLTSITEAEPITEANL